MSRIEQLEDRIAELETCLGLTAKIPRNMFPAEVFRVGAHSRKKIEAVVGVLLTREFADREALYAALYGDRPESDWPESPNIIPVLVSGARKVLKHVGVEIVSVRERGYYLDPANKAKLRAAITAHEQRSAA